MRSSGRSPSAIAAAPSALIPFSGDLERAQVADIQRARLLAAMTEVVCERGAGHATVARVVERAGVSRRTFYELFDDREDCFLAAFEEGMERASRYVLEGYDPGAKWAGRLRTALTGLLTFLTCERDAGRLLIDGSLGAGPRALERRGRVLAQIITVIDEGRTLKGAPSGAHPLGRKQAGKETGNGEGLSPLTAEGIAGGLFAVIHSRLMEDGDAPLVELVGPLMAMIVLPYLGTAASRRELARPVPKAPSDARSVASDPLRDLDMRLTYRTIRVLLAIGELGGQDPHPSNRQVGDAAGIRDQGQVSKLLARLGQLDLIENVSSPRVKGEPNAWTLTTRGAKVREVLSV